jgi:Phage tail assembly chaperone protein, TAC
VSETFGRASLRLAALAARTLGWRPQEFWAATPAELANSLGLGEIEAVASLDRGQLQRMMERDNDRPG